MPRRSRTEVLRGTPGRGLALLVSAALLVAVDGCGPGRGGTRRRRDSKLLPLVYKQHVPNVPEHSLAASGPPLARIRRDDEQFRKLIPNYNPDIVFRDEEGNGADRIMTQLCKEKLDTLAISVMNQWPGVKLRVTEAWDEQGLHGRGSLHHEGRAVDLTTSDKDRAKYGMLARLAVEAGFHWVYYEGRSHVHCSVKPESSFPSKYGGCFPGNSTVLTSRGELKMESLEVGHEVLSATTTGELLFSTVYTFLHREKHAEQLFIVVYTNSRNSTLSLTPWHLIFISSKDCLNPSIEFDKSVIEIFAKDLKVGDYVFEVRGADSVYCTRVTGIQLVSMTGVYAPVTVEGTIVVDRTIASCYAVVENHATAHLILGPIRTFYNLKRSLQFVTDKLFYFVSYSTSTRDECGVNWYAEILYKIASFLGLV